MCEIIANLPQSTIFLNIAKSCRWATWQHPSVKPGRFYPHKDLPQSVQPMGLNLQPMVWDIHFEMNFSELSVCTWPLMGWSTQGLKKAVPTLSASFRLPTIYQVLNPVCSSLDNLMPCIHRTYITKPDQKWWRITKWAASIQIDKGLNGEELWITYMKS